MKIKITKRRKMRLDAVLDGSTEFVPVIDLDPAYIRPRMNYITDRKEELDIYDKNIILQGEEFPLTAENGQIVRKNGKTYIYREQEPTVRVVNVPGYDLSREGHITSTFVVNHGMHFEITNPLKNLKCRVFAGASGLMFSYVLKKNRVAVFSDSIVSVEGENVLSMDIELEAGTYTIICINSLSAPGFRWQFISEGHPYPYTSERLNITGSTMANARWIWFYNWSYEIHE